MRSFAGCFTSDSVIVVQTDGSGTVTNTILLKSATMELLKSLQPSVEAEKVTRLKAARRPKEFFSEARVREATASMGEGVTFQSMEPLKSEGWEGVKATLCLQGHLEAEYNMRSESAVAAIGPRAVDVPLRACGSRLAREADDRDAARTALKENLQDDRSDAEDGRLGDEQGDDGAVQDDVRGLSASVAVEVAGPIVKTNADFVSGSKVTLLAIDFNQMMASGADFEMFGAITDGTMPLSEAREKLKTTKGLSMQLQPEVSVGIWKKISHIPGCSNAWKGLLVILCCAILSAGCLTVDSVIVVHPDGIGSVTYTLFLKSPRSSRSRSSR